MPKESSSSSRKYCSHCNQTISRRQFQEHKKKYFNEKTKKWSTSEPVGTDGSPGGSGRNNMPGNANDSN